MNRRLRSVADVNIRQGAVLAMTRELAMVHAREGIRINSICPYVIIYVQ
jgi:NAD(P)-dependent dehydrogenase (short-subunit alcohol dehydrogenase family)